MARVRPGRSNVIRTSRRTIRRRPTPRATGRRSRPDDEGRNGRPTVPNDVRLSVEQAVRRIRDGKAVIVIDDEDRENEGDVVFAASLATPQLVNFALKHGRGILCAP